MIPRPPKPVSMELNLAPMVDVMMCLIIFFMLASAMVSAENRPVNLPYAVAAQEVEKRDLGARVVINIRPSRDRPKESDFVVVRLEPQPDGGMQLVEKTLRADEVSTFLSGAKARAKSRGEEIRCVIRADKDVMYRDVEVVLRGCGLAKIAKITFSANAGEDPGAG